jgi:hypothetical protein
MAFMELAPYDGKIGISPLILPISQRFSKTLRSFALLTGVFSDKEGEFIRNLYIIFHESGRDVYRLV